MSKVGVIFCAHNTLDYLPRSLTPWIYAKKLQVGCHEILICAVSMPFEGFAAEPDDGTRQYLRDRLRAGEIDHLVWSETPKKETDARGEALQWLVSQGVETLVQWDSDEFSQPGQIEKILKFIDTNPLSSCFRFSYKNLVFTENQYLAEPFTPMRAHRVRVGTYLAHGFWDDNNVIYRGTLTRDFKRDIDMAAKTVPKNVAFIPHVTWLNCSRSRNKVNYQTARGWKCSFAWDDSKGGLIFNPEMPEPEVLTDE